MVLNSDSTVSIRITCIAISFNLHGRNAMFIRLNRWLVMRWSSNNFLENLPRVSIANQRIIMAADCKRVSMLAWIRNVRRKLRAPRSLCTRRRVPASLREYSMNHNETGIIRNLLRVDARILQPPLTCSE